MNLVAIFHAVGIPQGGLFFDFALGLNVGGLQVVKIWSLESATIFGRPEKAIFIGKKKF